MQIQNIGTTFKGLNFLRKKPAEDKQQKINSRPRQYDTFEIHRNIGEWKVCLAENTYHGTKNFTVEKIQNGRDYYSISGHVLEHNTKASEFGCAYGCFLTADDKKKVDEYIKFFQNGELTEKKIEKLVSEILEPALKKQGEMPLYY